MRTSSAGFELPDFDLHAAIEGLRAAFTPRGGERDIRTAILVELADEPMHGHQLIQAIRARTEGAWTPAPGAVYPELQLLADEGLVTAEQAGERKVYALTDAGRSQASTAADEDRAPRRGVGLDLPKAGARLAQAMSGFGHSATPEQTERAVAIVDEARRKLYAILAED